MPTGSSDEPFLKEGLQPMLGRQQMREGAEESKGYTETTKASNKAKCVAQPHKELAE